MQQYMQANTPPSFWQQYGSWIGYAAAASVSTVMAFLYVNQLSQNDHLVADVKNLKSQIEVIQNTPAPAAKTDTIYLVQKESDIEPRYTALESAANPERIAFQQVRTDRKKSVAEFASSNVNSKGRSNVEPDESAKPTENQRLVNVEKQDFAASNISENNIDLTANSGLKSFSSDNQGNLSGASATKTLDGQFVAMDTKNSITANNGYSASRKMNYELASRLSSRQVQRALNPMTPQGVTTNPQTAKTQIASAAPTSEKKVEQVAKAENVIPKFNIKAPYRFGAGIMMDGNGNSKTVVGEVIVAKKFSITTGITWLKTKPMEFFTEKIFREKNRQDFKRSHPGDVPLAFDVYNIKVNPSMVQIPLTVAFRNNMKDNWAYFAGVGTNVNISSREKVSFDCKAPKGEFFSQGFEKKTDMPLVNSVNFSMGIEKSWHPIVVQAEGYLYTYFQPLTPLSHSAGPGLKLKVLYQIGGKM
ncbi:hypothetical protein FEN17_21425 [Dyadobacter luticola]|uniref:Uncharacterized protein n=2 Tax=Dyadobacter luticola TaxID=1979387 RepID=A0A5R9KTR9_9BACT|nr:hypothetical protein FEN17_21425 [Dyadobacter luticola]